MATSHIEVPLTQGKVSLVSPEDYPRIADRKWMATCIKGVWYATRGAVQPDHRQRIEYLHRAILAAQPGQNVDHINGDTLDNRRENLRFCTASQNNANRRRQKNNSTGFVGVYSIRGKFEAYLFFLGKSIYLGRFDTADEAALARDKKAVELFGPFARTNFDLAVVLGSK